MDYDPIHATPAAVFSADLSPCAVVTVSRTEVWSSLAVLAGAAFVALAGSGLIVWLSLAGA
jgi:hypothetical protein